MTELLDSLNIDTTEAILYIIMLVCAWLLLREIKCWYWKINDITAEQRKQTQILEEMLRVINPNSEYFNEEKKPPKNYYLH